MGLENQMMYGRGDNPEAGEFADPALNNDIEDERFDRKKVVDLMHISEEELGELKARVEANDGTVIMAIHPFYDIYTEMLYENVHNEKLSPEKLEKTERIRRILKKLLGGDAANTPPVVVFEEYEHQGITKPAIEGYTGENNTAYYVDTLYDNATPLLDPSENIKQSDYSSDLAAIINFRVDALEIAQKNYQILIDTLKAAGTKRIIIGGMDLVINDHGHEERLINDDGTPTQALENYKKEGKAPRLHLRRCVAQTWDDLKEHFEAHISNFSAPNNRKDIARIIEEFIEEGDKNE